MVFCQKVKNSLGIQPQQSVSSEYPYTAVPHDYALHLALFRQSVAGSIVLTYKVTVAVCNMPYACFCLIHPHTARLSHESLKRPAVVTSRRIVHVASLPEVKA